MAVAKSTHENATRRTSAQTATSDATLIRARAARSTRQRVEFHKLGAGEYVVRCVHGVEYEGAKRYTTARKAASPEQWCDKCAAEAERVAAEDHYTPRPEPADEGDEAPEDGADES